MITHLIKRLEKLAEESHDPKIREAAKRDARGFRRALDEKLMAKAAG